MKQSTKQNLLIRVLTTLGGWAVAFAIVYLLLFCLGGWLESLPRALNALIFTGILVPIMGNVIMPRISAAVTRLISARKE